MYWVLEGRDEDDRERTLSRVELPPPGYTGSLRGTSWDPDVMVKAYEQGGGA